MKTALEQKQEEEEGLGGWSRQETEKAMAPHSSTLTWKIPWTEEPGGLRVGHH